MIDIFEKGQILRTFSGLAPSNFFFTKTFHGSICTLPIYSILPTSFQENRRGWNSPPERVKKVNVYGYYRDFRIWFFNPGVKAGSRFDLFKARSVYNRNKTLLQIPTLKKKLDLDPIIKAGPETLPSS